MVFTVGNLPYTMSEVRTSRHLFFCSNDSDTTQSRLIDIFKSVGHVVGFRYVSRVTIW